MNTERNALQDMAFQVTHPIGFANVAQFNDGVSHDGMKKGSRFRTRWFFEVQSDAEGYYLSVFAAFTAKPFLGDSGLFFFFGLGISGASREECLGSASDS